jgi:hypothetical protein
MISSLRFRPVTTPEGDVFVGDFMTGGLVVEIVDGKNAEAVDMVVQALNDYATHKPSKENPVGAGSK